MAYPKGMGIGAMFVLLILAVGVLPLIVRMIDRMEPHFIISGFQDAAPVQQAHSEQVQVPAGAAASMASAYHPDSMCRSPNGSGQPCPEGTFCDGVTQSCVPTHVGGSVPDTGYFA